MVDAKSPLLLMTAALWLMVILLPQSVLAENAADAAADLAEAASSVEDAPGEDELGLERRGLHWLDWTILVGYGIGVIGLGYYYSRRQSSTGEYFIGSGNMSSVLIGLSLFATLLSTISYLSVPGEIIKHGPLVILGTVLAIPLAFVIVGYGLIPLYMRQRVTSAYELLDQRLGTVGRTLGAVMFIVLRLIWMSLLIFLSAETLIMILDSGGGPAWMFGVMGAIFLIGLIGGANGLIRMWRRAEIQLDQDALTLHEGALGYRHTHRWPRGHVAELAVDWATRGTGISGGSARTKPLFRLRVRDMEGDDLPLLRGRKEPELAWLVNQVSDHLGIAAGKNPREVSGFG